MRFLFYTHSLISDWNHGNAHFLRGVMRDLNRRGHETLALEPANATYETRIFGPDRVKVQGTLVGLLRRY